MGKLPAEIEAMPAGGELDAIVAEKVMGWSDVRKTGPHNYSGDSACEPHYAWMGKSPIEYAERTRVFSGPVPSYSIDIAAAWTVFERLEEGSYIRRLGGRWWCKAYVTAIDKRPINEGVEMSADTAPLAIARAALLAVMP